MFNLLSEAAPFIGWTVIITVALVLSLIAIYIFWLILDFVGRYIACNAFAYKAHWHKPEDTRWERTQRTASIAWYMLWRPSKSFHSGNDYMIELVYHHPFRWWLVNHWDLIPDDQDEESN